MVTRIFNQPQPVWFPKGYSFYEIKRVMANITMVYITKEKPTNSRREVEIRCSEGVSISYPVCDTVLTVVTTSAVE